MVEGVVVMFKFCEGEPGFKITPKGEEVKGRKSGMGAGRVDTTFNEVKVSTNKRGKGVIHTHHRFNQGGEEGEVVP